MKKGKKASDVTHTIKLGDMEMNGKSLDEKILESFRLLTEEEKLFILAGLINTLSEQAACASDHQRDNVQAPSA